MNIRSNSVPDRQGNPRRFPNPSWPATRPIAGVSRELGLLWSWAIVLFTTMTGCGYSQGQFLYLLGAGRSRTAEAKFRLTDQPILILVDDADNCCDSPEAKSALIDELSQQLLKNKAAARIIPRQTLEGLRQAEPGFEARGCREVGELAGAEQVIWIEVRDFLAQEQIYDVDHAAQFSVTVKVINVLEKDRRSRVRLWPTSPRGHQISVSLSGSEVMMAKTRQTIARELASRLAVDVAKLFYDHVLDDFERDE
ncbi:MAG: hypothetical protein KJ749_15060 [Planctomycetes bacterium]|nr:hypothetical protein [Planctomycetota bacterium]